MSGVVAWCRLRWGTIYPIVVSLKATAGSGQEGDVEVDAAASAAGIRHIFCSLLDGY